MEVFLTGATGTIGSTVTRKLVDAGHSVTALTRSETARNAASELGASCFGGDLGEPESWLERALEMDAFIHLGSSFDDATSATDMKIVQALMQNKVKRRTPLRFIYTGGCWLFPESSEDSALTETTPFQPIEAFNWMPDRIRSLQLNRSISLVIIHPALVCDANSGPIAEMMSAARSKRPFETYAHAETFWPLIAAEDLADIYVTAVTDHRYRLTLNGCAIPGVTVAELADTVSSVTGNKLEIKTVPFSETAGPDYREGYARSQIMSPVQAQRLLKWEPAIKTPADLAKLSKPTQNARKKK